MRLRFLAFIGTFLVSLGFYGMAFADNCVCKAMHNGLCFDMICTSGASTSSSSSSKSTKTTTSSTKNLTIRITDDHDPVMVGDILVYRIKLTNDGTTRIKTDVQAYLDRYTNYLSASDDAEDVGSHEVDWTDITIDADDTVTLTLRVRVLSSASSNQSLHMQVEAGDAQDSETTSTNANCNNYSSSNYYSSDNCYNNYNGNSATALTITDTPDPVSPGSIVTYSIDVRNLTNYSTNISVLGFFDANTSFVTASNGGIFTGGNTISWSNIGLSSYQDRTLTAQVRVNNSVSYGSTLTFRVQGDSAQNSITTNVDTSNGSSGSNSICTYYNAYLRQNYPDFCDQRHQSPQF